MSKMKPEVRVAKGVARLDEKMPGWADKIKPTKLEMYSNQLCVLGQLGDGNCNAMREQLGLRENQEVTHGFRCEDHQEGEILTKLWLVEIKERRKKK